MWLLSIYFVYFKNLRECQQIKWLTKRWPGPKRPSLSMPNLPENETKSEMEVGPSKNK